MRALGRIALLVAAVIGAGCAGVDNGRGDVTARSGDERELAASRESSSTATPSAAATAVQESGPFAGSWAACEGAATPDECARYHLVQRGDRICGTWSYVASGQVYEGRVIARATSATDARRTRVCGRAGAETGTACDAGWQTIDAPLRLCDGRLSDLDGKDGTCFADYERRGAEKPDDDLLVAEPWLRGCLTDGQ